MAAYVSVKSGDWNDPLTWGSASYPSIAGDTATISTGHVVIYNVSSTVALGLVTVYGTFRFSTAMSTRINIGASAQLRALNPSGKIYVGNSDADPIPAAYTAIIEGGANYSISIGESARIYFYGDPAFLPLVKRQAKLAVNWTTGKSFEVVGNLAGAWRVGDEILIERFQQGNWGGATYNTAYYATVASVVNSGANSIVTINEANPGYTCFAGGYVFNENQNNIVVRSATPAVGAATYSGSTSGVLSKSQFTASDLLADQCVARYVTFHGLYYTSLGAFLMKGALIRNSYLAIYASTGTTFEDCYLLSCYQPQATVSIYFSRCYFVACNSYVMYNPMNCFFDDCFFAVSNNGFQSAYGMKFNRCVFRGISSCVSLASFCYFNDCYFYKNNYVTAQLAGVVYFKSCFLGIDENGATMQNASDLYITFPGESFFRDCSAVWGGGAAKPTVYKYNPSYRIIPDTGDNNYFQNINGAENYIIGGYGLAEKNVSVKNAASCSLNITPLANCGSAIPAQVSIQPLTSFTAVKWTENNVPASAQHRRVYIRGAGWTSFPTAAQLYVEAEYYNAAGAWTTTTKKSTEVLTGNGTWLALTLDFTPGRVGPVTYRVVLAKYEAGASVYLDHALYYSATDFVEAAFDWGKSVLPAARANLPAVADVELGVSYDAGGTVYTGTLAPILTDRDLEADVSGSAISGAVGGFSIEGEVVMED